MRSRRSKALNRPPGVNFSGLLSTQSARRGNGDHSDERILRREKPENNFVTGLVIYLLFSLLTGWH